MGKRDVLPVDNKMSGGGFFSFDDDLPVPKDDDASAEQQEAPPKDGDPANEDHAAANPARPPSPPSRPSARIKITDDPYAQFAMTGLITDDPSKVPHFLEEGSRDGPTWARLAGTDSHGWPDGGNPLWLYNSVTNIYVQTSSQGMYRAVEGASVGVVGSHSGDFFGAGFVRCTSPGEEGRRKSSEIKIFSTNDPRRRSSRTSRG